MTKEQVVTGKSGAGHGRQGDPGCAEAKTLPEFCPETPSPSPSPINCTLSPITCRCGGTHRPLTTPAGVQLDPGQTEAERRTRLLVNARSVGDANRAMTGKPPKCSCQKGARCLACVERDGLTKAQA